MPGDETRIIKGRDTASGRPQVVGMTNGRVLVDPLAAVQPSVDSNSSYVDEPAANTAAVVTLAAAGPGNRNVLGQAAWSYDAIPTAGSLTIEDGAGTTIFKVDITDAGPGFFQFIPGLRGSINTAMIATLAAGGAAVNGIVSLHAWME
jgi:hypothetical protein